MTTYTIDGYRIVHKNLNWLVYKWDKVTPKKGENAGIEREDWVFKNKYHRSLGDALGQVYDFMLADGRKDLKDLKSMRTHVDNLFKKLQDIKPDEEGV